MDADGPGLRHRLERAERQIAQQHRLLPELHAALRAALAVGERVAVVGHEPWLSDLLGWLVFGVRMIDSEARTQTLDFGKGGLAWVGGKPEPGAMSLRAFLPPRALRRLAKS